MPQEKVDAVVSGGALTLETAEQFERLGPFGAGNPAQRLLVPAAGIEHVTALGEDRKHARFSLVGGGARGVAFRRSQGSLAAAGARPHNVAMHADPARWWPAPTASLHPSRPLHERHGDGVAGSWSWWPT